VIKVATPAALASGTPVTADAGAVESSVAMVVLLHRRDVAHVRLHEMNRGDEER
jgi:hypothetical protein